jgi:ribosome assembly protein SQT1
MAAGSVDGSIVLFDVAHRYAVRRKIEGAHEVEAVIKVEFVKAGPRGANGWILTSCGNDGVVRRWDCRGGTAAAAKGLMKELRGHRGGGDGGGILGFVQGPDGSRIVTAGDE